jgi:FkbM family methyltransferase
MRHLPIQVRRIRVWRDRLYQALGAGGWDDNDEVDSLWPRSLQGPIWGRKSRMRMKLDLTDWLQRRAYFTGRFYQEDLEELLSALLRRGDNFVDVGANIGLVTLLASRLVGDAGTVWAFEPNPEAFARLEEHIDINGLRCNSFNKGLGSEKGVLTLSRFGRHTGKATLLHRNGVAAETVQVEICRGDDALANLDAAQPTVLKIDVEGFEVAVLEGLGRILDENVAIAIEVSKSWLKLAGTSEERLHSFLRSHRLEAFGFQLEEHRFHRELIVWPMRGPLDEDQYDCLFMRPDSIFAQRLKADMRTEKLIVPKEV